MKKIIRHVFYKTQCQFCGTEFAFEKSDCHVRPTAGNKKILPFTECPNCGKETPATADKSTQITMQPATENADVSLIAKMQQQIDTFKAVLLHASERILHDNKCNMVVIDPLDNNDKHIINNIIRFIDEHLNDKQENGK